MHELVRFAEIPADVVDAGVTDELVVAVVDRGLVVVPDRAQPADVRDCRVRIEPDKVFPVVAVVAEGGKLGQHRVEADLRTAR
jgi:hypothetical protein